MKKIYFVTGNKNKVEEAKKILQYPLKIAEIDLDEIQSLDIYKVVQKKAEVAFEKLKKPLIVEDVGVYLDAWNGFPGPLVKFLHEAGKGSYELLLEMLASQKNKKVHVKAVIGFHNGKKIHIIEGSFDGTIVERKGEKGWGFDPYVIPDGYTKTFGELPEKIKNSISHRARALKNLKEFLDSQKEQNEL